MSTIVFKTVKGIARISALADIQLKALMEQGDTIKEPANRDHWRAHNSVKIKTLEMLSSVMMGYADEIHIELKDLRYLL